MVFKLNMLLKVIRIIQLSFSYIYQLFSIYEVEVVLSLFIRRGAPSKTRGIETLTIFLLSVNDHGIVSSVDPIFFLMRIVF